MCECTHRIHTVAYPSLDRWLYIVEMILGKTNVLFSFLN